MGYLFRRLFLLPDSFGVKAFHVLVALSMIMPNFLGVVQLAQAARLETNTNQLAQSETGIVSSYVSENMALPVKPIQEYAHRNLNGSKLSELAAVLPQPTPPPGLSPQGEVSASETLSTTVTAMDGSVNLVFAAETLSDTIAAIDVYVNPSPNHSGSSQGIENFEILAFDQTTGENVTRFNEAKPVEIQIAYDETLLTGDEYGLTLYYYDEMLATWRPLQSQIDPENNVLMGWSDHFSDFKVDIQTWQAARTPTMDAFQVSTFTGAATYSYSFWMPPGPGGFQPSLSLSYNSQVVDSASVKTQASWVGMGWSFDTGYIERNMNGTDEYEGDDTFSLIVNGVSSLLLPVADDIPADTKTPFHASDETFWKIWWDWENEIWIILDKGGNEYRFGEGVDNENKAMYPYERNNPHCGQLVWRWPITSMKNIYEQVISYTYTKDTKGVIFKCQGDEYVDLAIYPETITYPNNRYQVQFSWGPRLDYDLAWEDGGSTQFFYRRVLEEVLIKHDEDGGEPFEQTIRKYKLEYNEAVIYPGWQWSAGEGTLALEHIQEYGLDDNPLPAYTFVYTDGLHLTAANNGYGGGVKFTYTPWADPDAWVNSTDLDISRQIFQNVGTICEHPGNPTGWTGGADCLHTPDDALVITGETTNTTLIQDHLENFQPGAAYRIKVYAMSENSATNISLGIVDHGITTYADPITLTGNYQYHTSEILYVDKSADPSETTFELKMSCSSECLLKRYFLIRVPMRYRVQTKTLYPNANDPTISYTYSYDYEGAATNTPANSGYLSDPNGHPFTKIYEEFRGHETVYTTAPGGLVTIFKFHQDDINKGKTEWVETREREDDGTPYDGPLLSKVHTDYAINYAPNGVNPGPRTKPDGTVYTDFDITWSYTEAEASCMYEGTSTCLGTWKDYVYAPNYGNLLSVIESKWDGTTKTPYRRSETGYVPNEDIANGVYLVSLPAYTNQFECTGGDCQTTMLGSVWYLYDGEEYFAVAPSVGKLTGQRTYVCPSGSTTQCTPGSGWHLYTDIEFGYDAYGNQTSLTTYDQYGYWNGGQTNMFGQGNARTTTTCFGVGTYPTCDNSHPNGYHTYLTWMANPLGQATAFLYDYGLGVATAMDGPNANDTVEARYDEFGRMTKIWFPSEGDSESNPTQKFDYFDTGTLENSYFYTEATQKIDDTGRQISIQKYYDGLGRLLQTHALDVEIAEAAGACEGFCDTVVFYQYDDAGRPLKQSIPFGYAEAKTYVSAEPSGLVGTVTTYDVLGRVDTVTGPDGTETGYLYTIDSENLRSTVSVTDGNGNTTVTKNDIWGQTVRVEPPAVDTPNASEDHPAIDYEYDALGRLTDVHKNNLDTHIEYDLAGRKTSMNDPDMGYWEYEYNALGNLLTQTDANGVSISFTYDALNRLETKTYTIPEDSNIVSPGDVVYYYDQGGATANALGQRTGMADATGGTTWSYDARGRVTEVTRSFYPELDILGGPYSFGYEYNKADQVVALTYPDEEVVTTDYTHNGVPKSLTSSLAPNVYVTEANYDILGRMTSIGYGNGVATTYSYYAFTPANAQNGGRLENIVVTNGQAENLLDLTYNQYDAVGNIKKITDASRDVGGQVLDYTYDELNRLQTAKTSGGNFDGYDLAFNYDNLGRLDAKSSTVDNVTTTLEYAYDETAPTHPHAAVSLGNATDGYNTYAYDANGNMIFRQEDGIAYDQKWTADNKLYQVSWTTNSQPYTTTFVYDGDGNRLLKIEDGPFNNENREETTLYLGGLYEQQFDTSGVNLSDTWQTAYFPGAGMLLVSKHGATMVSFTPPIWNYALARLNQALQEFAEKLRTWGRQIQANWQAFWTRPEPANKTAQTDFSPPTEETNAESYEADWLASAYAGIAAQEYFVTATGEAYQAPNRAQDVRTRFEKDGAVSWTDRTLDTTTSAWEVAWTLLGVGHETTMQRVDKPVYVRSEENRFEYTYTLGGADTDFTEWYLNTEHGVEQGFTLAARLPEKGC